MALWLGDCVLAEVHCLHSLIESASGGHLNEEHESDCGLVMLADGSVWWEVKGATSCSEEATGAIWQPERGGSNGGLPFIPQDWPQAPQTLARYGMLLLLPAHAVSAKFPACLKTALSSQHFLSCGLSIGQATD